MKRIKLDWNKNTTFGSLINADHNSVCKLQSKIKWHSIDLNFHSPASEICVLSRDNDCHLWTKRGGSANIAGECEYIRSTDYDYREKLLPRGVEMQKMKTFMLKSSLSIAIFLGENSVGNGKWEMGNRRKNNLLQFNFLVSARRGLLLHRLACRFPCDVLFIVLFRLFLIAGELTRNWWYDALQMDGWNGKPKYICMRGK